MSALQFRRLKNRALSEKFTDLFNGVVYQVPELGDQWIYETDKALNEDNWFYFPEGTTEDVVFKLVKKSIKEKKDYVYKLTKDIPMPAGVKHYNDLIERGCLV